MTPGKYDLEQAVKALKKGEVVAYPTETFYGLAVDSQNEKAIAVLYHLKKRDPHKPISLIVPDVESITTLVSSFPKVYHKLIKRFWPGPLTLIFPASESIPKILTGVDETVAIRVSSHPVAKSLCCAWGAALTATSANLSGIPPCNDASEVEKNWGKQVSCVLDGGTTIGGKGSTIIHCTDTEKTCYIIREGVVDVSEIQQYLPQNYNICKV